MIFIEFYIRLNMPDNILKDADYSNSLCICYWDNNMEWEDHQDDKDVFLIKNIKLTDSSILLTIAYEYKVVRPYHRFDEHKNFLESQQEKIITIPLDKAVVTDFIDHIEIEFDEEVWSSDDDDEEEEEKYEPFLISKETYVYCIWKNYGRE